MMGKCDFVILFNVRGQTDHLETMLFAELLARLRSVGVVWDLHIMSHGNNHAGHPTDRAVEIAVYRDGPGACTAARTALAGWLRSEHIDFTVTDEQGG